jgi:hypothetical protein
MNHGGGPALTERHVECLEHPVRQVGSIRLFQEGFSLRRLQLAFPKRLFHLILAAREWTEGRSARFRNAERTTRRAVLSSSKKERSISLI